MSYNAPSISNGYAINASDLAITADNVGTISLAPGKWVTDAYQEERYKAINEILTWLTKEQRGQLGPCHTCVWSKCIGGFEAKANFMESSVVNSMYALSIQIKPTNEPGKSFISKDIYFSSDTAVYDWFKEHDIYKLFSALENDIKTYYTSYRNLITTLDLELNL